MRSSQELLFWRIFGSTSPLLGLLSIWSTTGCSAEARGESAGTDLSNSVTEVQALVEPADALAAPSALHSDGHDEAGEEATSALRELAAAPITWENPARRKRAAVSVKLLGFNDFHGQISAGRNVGNRPVGGAVVLGAYLNAAAKAGQDATFIAHAGDHVGASPPASALLQDEPAIQFLNLLANAQCGYFERLNPYCNIVGTLGNHEFDEGKVELLRLVYGGNHAAGPFLESRYGGAKFPYISANVVYEKTGLPLLAPFVIKIVKNLPIAFIGAVLRDTPSIVTPTGISGLKFLDEATAINAQVKLLKRLGVRAFVVQIHQGGSQANYEGPTQAAGAPSGQILEIIRRLDDEIDVVISGHTHQFTNALVPNQNAKPILVTQAFSASTAFADIDLRLDRDTRDIIFKSARIVTTYADNDGLVFDPKIQKLVTDAETAVAPLVNKVIGNTNAELTRNQNAAGESALGNLIADAQRASVSADFAFMNPGGIRADLSAGNVTWGSLFTVQPFANSVVKIQLKGEQIYKLLEQQWAGQPSARLLQVSGLTYTWDNALPVGARVVEVRKDGIAIDLSKVYGVAVNSFLAAGGDNFSVLNSGTNPEGGPIDLDALISYIQSLPQPFTATVSGRIQRLN